MSTRKNSLIAFLSPLLLLAPLLWATPVASAQTVTVTVNGVVNADGVLRAQLCGDAVKFPGGCTITSTAPAKTGSVDVVFKDVPPGTYAFQTFHDSNNDMRLGIPVEGYAFGNDQPYPATFQQASIKVAGDTKASVKLIYMAAAQSGAQSGVPAKAGVVKTDVRDNGLYAALYAPAGAAKLPAIIAIGGSEGGLDTISGISNTFASHGYVVLSLAYWGAPGLPPTLEGIPLEYFDKAIAWLKQRPEVDASRMGMMGWSRGGEGVLLIGSRSPDLKAVMAMSPGSHVITGINMANPPASKPAWTLGGKPIPYFQPDYTSTTNGSMRQMMDASQKDIMNHPEAMIPVEKINGPILLLSGTADGIWNADLNSERVLSRLKAKGFKHSVEHVSYPDAGHLVFAGDPALGDGVQQAEAMRNIFGGTSEANAKAIRTSWTKVLAFFDAALKKKPS